MNNQFIFSFETAEPGEYVGKTHQEGSQKYLTAALSGCSIIKRKADYLLVPDDNSELAHYLANNFHYDHSFNTPFSNLKFKSSFWKNSKGTVSHDCLIIKDTSQVKKDQEKVSQYPTSPLTFKVISQTKKPAWKDEYYEHELEIEPLDLGVEGLPKITRIIFRFVAPLPGQSTVEKGLEETWLYNHKILTESAGKTFSMKVQRWKLTNSCLTFNDDWDFDLESFKENRDNVLKEKLLRNLDKICLNPMGDFAEAESLKSRSYRNATDYYYGKKPQGNAVVKIEGEKINLDQFKGDDYQEIRQAIINEIKKNSQEYWIENEGGGIVIKHKSGRKHWRDGFYWGKNKEQEWAEIEAALKNSSPQQKGSQSQKEKKWYNPARLSKSRAWITAVFLSLLLVIVVFVLVRVAKKKKKKN